MRTAPGFTLIELLVVVVIVGILAAIALPKFGTTRQAAYYSTMRTDLSNLRSLQEVYYQTDGAFRYSASAADVAFRPSTGVTLEALNILNDGQAWEAAVTHAGAEGSACVVGFGDPGGESWSASAGTPAVSVTGGLTGAPACND